MDYVELAWPVAFGLIYQYSLCVGLQKFKANSLGRWIIEAKICTYKLYTQSFLSLLMQDGWISDEVMCSIGIVSGSLIIIDSADNYCLFPYSCG